MGTITVRNLDDDVQSRLRRRAAANGRSMEAEARAILADAVGAGSFIGEWMSLAARHSGADLALPARSVPRDIEIA
jgi:plasmid stability protein